MTEIRAFVVDDEAPARMRVRELLERHADIVVAGEFGNGKQAIEAIRAEPPDVLFLDVQMPEIDGFAVLEALDRDVIPITVFVTAYDQYALKAFDAHAFDYLLKPFSDSRFDVALSKIRKVLGSKGQTEMQQAISAFLESRSSLDRLVVKDVNRTYFVKVEDVAWIGAAGAYVQLHTGTNRHLLRLSIGKLEEDLDRERFVRIHRSTIVNIDRIAELRPHFHGEFIVVMDDRSELKLSRTYRARLQERLGQML